MFKIREGSRVKTNKTINRPTSANQHVLQKDSTHKWTLTHGPSHGQTLFLTSHKQMVDTYPKGVCLCEVSPYSSRWVTRIRKIKSYVVAAICEEFFKLELNQFVWQQAKRKTLSTVTKLRQRGSELPICVLLTPAPANE